MPGVNLDGQSRADEEIELDDGSFVGATLTRCLLVYRGGKLPDFRNVRLIEPQWNFTDAASRTLGFLAIIRLDWPRAADELLAIAQARVRRHAGN